MSIYPNKFTTSIALTICISILTDIILQHVQYFSIDQKMSNVVIVTKMFLCYFCSGRNYMYIHSLELHVCNAMPIHVRKFDIVCSPVIQSQGLVFMSLKGTSLKHSFIILSVHIMYNQVNFIFTFLLQIFLCMFISTKEILFFSFINVLCVYILFFFFLNGLTFLLHHLFTFICLHVHT